jgi:multidrug efflux pump subunit AcrA (membrane-fusion protein)
MLAGCSGKGDAQKPEPKKNAAVVVLEPVKKESIEQLLDLTGETVAVESVVIYATVEGPIGYCPWREGDRVESAPDKPVRLIEVDRELYRAEVSVADAALSVAQAKLADMRAGSRPEEIAKARQIVLELEERARFAKIDLERSTSLVENGSLPREALEKAQMEHGAERAKLAAAKGHLEMLEAGYTKTAIAVQEASVKESQAKVELAKARLDECIVFAPFSGTITRVHVRKGDMATVKAPLLEMVDLGSLVIRAPVPEAHASSIGKGMKAKVVLDSLPGKTFTGRVARIYPELDPKMRTRMVEFSLEQPPAWAPGMFARLQLVLKSVEAATTVPQQAIVVTQAGGQVAFVVSDGKAVMRKLSTGIEQGGRVQVLSGLEPGERVVVAGQEKLKDGMEVRVPEPGKAGGKSAAPGGGPAGKGDGTR